MSCFTIYLGSEKEQLEKSLNSFSLAANILKFDTHTRISRFPLNYHVRTCSPVAMLYSINSQRM